MKRRKKGGKKAASKKRKKVRAKVLRDPWGRFVSRATKKVHLPPYRINGRFATHPLKTAARALREKKITRDEWLALRTPSEWPRSAVADILARAGVDVRVPADVERLFEGITTEVYKPDRADYDDDDVDDDDDFDDDDRRGLDLEAFEEEMDYASLDERDFWDLYDRTG